MTGLHILYLSPYFWPEEIGSAPYCSDLAFWLTDRGHHVAATAFRPHYPKPEPFAAWADGSRDEEEHRGVVISRVAVGGRGAGGVKDRLWNDLRYFFAVLYRAVTGRIGPTDVVVAYVPSIFTVYAAALVRLLRGARVIVVVHDIESGLATSLGMASGAMLPRLMRLVERLGLSFAQHVVVLTEGMREELVGVGCRRPITILPIWASVPAYSPIKAGKTPIIGYSGNFGQKQNLDQLLPLIEKLWRERPDVKVILRGDGSEKERIRRAIEAKGIGNTEFPPLAPAEEFVATLQSVDLHLVPQASNVANYALPSKLFSIMAAARPYICVAAPDSPLDVLARSSGGGVCVAPGDEDALWTAVQNILSDIDGQIAMGRKGRLFVEQNMNREKITRAYEYLLTDEDVSSAHAEGVR